MPRRRPRAWRPDMADLTRRAFGVLASSGALAGCATLQPQGFTEPLAPAGPFRLAPVHVSEDRVIRVVAGLRPYRASGFVVRAERLGDKTLVHNYGHGGGGITLSWGTSELAVDLGFAGPDRDYAVLGCGAVGLATARLIQLRGGRVTVYAKALPPQTTSNIAGGQWWPTSVFDAAVATPAFLAQYAQAARLAYRRYQLMVGDAYGIGWRRNYFVGQPSLEAAVGSLADVAPEARLLQTGEHPFGTEKVVQIDMMQVEPSIYLPAMMRDLLVAGGKLEVRELRDRAEVAALPEPVVFNCTGLGAGALFGDKELEPVRGQLVVLLPQPEVTYNLLSGPSYMFPRHDGIVLGGTFDHGVWETQPQPDITARILARQKALFARMKT
ncbi:MAG: FAD-binding oxidoreductase [Phenylobacterium sp.]|nr:MAG: FAD-binding oxidoreductase [Phenylobacterium sp.]